MKSIDGSDYDVVIIGAGISGLVCGCYLAKSGMKTLIVEKNVNPGGYCTSFVNKGFHFDSCAHALSSLRDKGRLRVILNELDLPGDLNIRRYDPPEIIITPKHKILINQEIIQTINNFQTAFPKENKQVKEFLNLIAFSPNSKIMQFRSKSFEDLILSYFVDKELIAVFLTIPFLLAGVFSFQLSAVVGCLLWREFMLDGGYYPEGGMQGFSDSLLKKFSDFQGDILLKKRAKKIIIKNKRVEGIILDDGHSILSKYVVSACDARQTFLELIDRPELEEDFINKLNLMLPSYSGFMVYLSLDKSFPFPAELKSNLYVINSDNLKTIHANFLNFDNQHYVITSPSVKDNLETNKISICLSSNAIYKEVDYWSPQNKNLMANKLIKLAENILPDLSKHIIFKGIATPATLEKWTLNFKGAGYGWGSTREQFCDPEISQATGGGIGNLYLTGHWSNLSSGIPFVASCAYDTADLILHKER